ncbi:P-glycoprotein 11 [Prunus dulcis]|uniref:p-glycoprotein 11 n=1 Tax=Prunus dulcis TaxID=3755 RepID=A0A4Y1R5U9_PRUDU|nr:P-glycoprotein 11 [Prunus dulcis]
MKQNQEEEEEEEEEERRSSMENRDHGKSSYGGDEKTDKVAFIKLFSFADKTDIMLMLIGTIGAMGNGSCMSIMTILVGEISDSFGTNQNNTHIGLSVVSKVSLKFVYLAIWAAVAATLQVGCWMVTGERQAARIRALYLKTILRQDIAFFDMETNGGGEVVGRMSGDTVLIQNAMGEKVGKFVQLFSTFIAGFIIAFIKVRPLTLVMLSCVPLLVAAGASISFIVTKMASHGQSAYAKAANVLDQTIGSIRTVASFTGEKKAITSYSKNLVDAYKSGVHEGSAAGIGHGFVMLVLFFSYALAVWFGSRMIREKGYSGGDVLNVILAVLTASMSLGQASTCLSAFAAGQVAAFKMFETISRRPEIDAYDEKGKRLNDIRGDIELREVFFSYPARPDEQIFDGFSLYIPSGTTAALVGESGSGKSTVISLIERFYDPRAGEVLIDGINLKEFQLKWIRSKIGLVSQEPVLFASNIKENIAYGKDGATLEEIEAAAQLANAAKFIDKLPQGFDTMVGEHGTQLSGGQKQRIAIARAVLKDPRILLLDEATSALDAESERIVQEALDRIMVNRTSVIVAHRLSTVRNADTIAIIHKGKMVERGSHSDLLKDPEGAYSQLIRLQEVNKGSEQTAEAQNKSEITTKCFRQLSQRTAFVRSLSRNSSVGSMRENKTLQADPEAPALPLEQPPKISMRRLVALNKPEIPVLLIGSVAAIITGVMIPIFGLLLSKVVKTFYEPPRQQKKDSEFWAIMFMTLGVASLLVIPASEYFFSVAGSKLIERIRLICFERVVHMEVGWFDEAENSSGAIGARLSSDAALVRALVGDTLAHIVESIATAAAGLFIGFTACWQLAFILLALIPLIGINGYVQAKFMKGFSADAKMMYEEASQVANDAVGSIRTVASFCAEEKVMDLYRRKCEGPTEAGKRQGLISGIGFGISFFSLFCVYATCFYAGAKLVEAGKTTFPHVFQLWEFLSPSSFAVDFSKAKNAAASIFAIIDRKSKIDSSDESGVKLDSVKGEIELHHVIFKYPSRPDIQIFRDLSLTIHCGNFDDMMMKFRSSYRWFFCESLLQTVALVGESGSGKSSVVALLQRFYDPDSGHITLDGIELGKFQLKWLRQQMGLVSQEPALFNDTIRANIAYGKEGDATEAEIIAASERTRSAIIRGQKQRIAIARAIIKNPKILLLDEATSALDAESERVVQDALDGVMVNRTTVVVAHRLSTIKNADVIAVVKNGVIVERGKHDTLMNISDGSYASLVALHMSASTA